MKNKVDGATYPTETIEYVIEERQNRSSRHFDDVVQRLATVVSHSTVGVEETRQDRLHELLHVQTAVLWIWRNKKQGQDWLHKLLHVQTAVLWIWRNKKHVRTGFTSRCTYRQLSCGYGETRNTSGQASQAAARTDSCPVDMEKQETRQDWLHKLLHVQTAVLWIWRNKKHVRTGFTSCCTYRQLSCGYGETRSTAGLASEWLELNRSIQSALQALVVFLLKS